MNFIPLGPIALPAAPVLLWLAAWAAIWLADRLARPDRAGTALLHAVLAGLAAARLAHLALNLPAYGAQPLSMLDLRDGGWSVPAGLSAGLAWVAWQAVRHVPWRRPLMVGASVGLLMWTSGTALLSAAAVQQLPDLALTDLRTGQRVPLRQLAAGHPVVVNLWASWCGPCRQEMPVLAAAQAGRSDVVFVFANQGEARDVVSRYLSTQGLQLSNVLLDHDRQLATALGSRGLPTTALFDAQGRHADTHAGVLNGGALAAMLKAVSAQP